MFQEKKIDLIVKVGGSLICGDCIETCRIFAAETNQRKLMILPGGGDIDLYLEKYHEKRTLLNSIFNETTLLSQDICGLLLCNIDPRFVPVRTIHEAEEAILAGSVPVLLPSKMMMESNALRCTNRFSSDSMALYIAEILGVSEVALMKSRKPLVQSHRLEDLKADITLVDEVFCDYAIEGEMEIRFISPDTIQEFADYLKTPAAFPEGQTLR